MSKNSLYFGDNLEVLRRYIKDGSIDLVYLDPPFNSKADYNVLFKEDDGTMAESQIKAFKDTWHWSEAASAYEEFVLNAPHQASQALQAFRGLLGCNDMLAYLTMMAPRLLELRRILKPTGSLYLHCDPTASHYLKILLDGIFGKESFRNEIIWKRSTSHGNVGRNYGSLYDSIFFYTKSAKPQGFAWNQQFRPFSPEYIKKFRWTDEDGRRFQDVSLRNPGVRPNLQFDFTASNGVTYSPHPNGWACNRERLEKYDREGRLFFPKDRKGKLRLKMYLDESQGTKLQNLWDDIPAINSQAQERLGYPTQKPEALLERIIKTSSNEGDVILDPFCGCGTAISVSQRLGRRWIGIDITALATTLIKKRLKDAHGTGIAESYEVVGEPTSHADAEELAKVDRYQFQYWALGLVDARPIQEDEKKGSDKGVDGRLKFHDEPEGGRVKQVIFSVKSGRLKNEYVRELPHILDREKAQIGVLITLEKPTQPMRDDAGAAGYYHSPWGTQHPKVQIITVEELLAGKLVDLPPTRDHRTFKTAPKARKEKKKDPRLPFEDE